MFLTSENINKASEEESAQIDEVIECEESQTPMNEKDKAWRLLAVKP
jgi:hypothetical protein